MKKHRYPHVLLALVYAVGTLGVFSGYYTAYHRQSFQAQVKILPEDHLEMLSFSEQSFRSIQWMEDESEFEWEGKLYDVSRISKTKDGYIIVCEQDALEELLLAMIDLTREKSHQGLKKGNPQPQFFSPGNDLVPHVRLTSNKDLFNSPESIYFSIHPEISFPPPRLIVA